MSQDTAALRFVLSQVREYLNAGYRVAAVILEDADVRGPSGRAWLRRLAAAAVSEQVELPTPVTVAGTDLEDLERLVPA